MDRRTRHLAGWLGLWLGLGGLGVGCRQAAPPERAGGWFGREDVARLAARPGVDFIAGLRGFQQTTDYTCVNAWRFFSLWFEAHHFARELWYTRIAVRVPERRAEGVQVP